MARRSQSGVCRVLRGIASRDYPIKRDGWEGGEGEWSGGLIALLGRDRSVNELLTYEHALAIIESCTRGTFSTGSRRSFLIAASPTFPSVATPNSAPDCVPC